jgi:hypothetical protein
MKSTDLARLVEREKDLSARLDELTEGSKSKDECLAKMASTRKSLAVEVRCIS